MTPGLISVPGQCVSDLDRHPQCRSGLVKSPRQWRINAVAAVAHTTIAMAVAMPAPSTKAGRVSLGRDEQRLRNLWAINAQGLLAGSMVESVGDQSAGPSGWPAAGASAGYSGQWTRPGVACGV